MDQKQSVTPEVADLIRRFKNRLEGEKIRFSRIILFGSHAKGTANASSDIDLCVLSSDFGRDYHGEMVRLMKAAAGLTESVDMDIVPYHPDDLSDRYDPLAREIRESGIPLN